MKGVKLKISLCIRGGKGIIMRVSELIERDFRDIKAYVYLIVNILMLKTIN